MPVELYPSIAKIKRNGVYENLPGFVPGTVDISVEQMIATSESSNVAQYVHNVGEYFILNDTLYRAIAKINIGDSIVIGTNCEVTVLGNNVAIAENNVAELQDITEKMVDILSFNEPISIDSSVVGTRYINYGTGALGSSSSGATFGHTDYIDVSLFEFITYKRATTSSGSPQFGMAFYDKNKNYISGQRAVANIDLSYVDTTLKVPNNATYARFTTINNTESYGQFSVYGNNNLINNYIKNSKYYNNLWNYGNPNYNKAIHALTGALTSNSDYDTTDFIPVTEGDVIFGHGSRFYCYDSEYTAISGATGVLVDLDTELYNGMHYYKIPAGASYFRCCASAQFEPYQFVLYLASPYERNNTSTKRVLYTLGDSITRGMYAEIGTSSSSGPTSLNYPYYIANINNYTLVNLGNSGSGWANVGSPETQGDPSTARNAKDVVDANTFADADIITMAWGVNDWKGAAQDIILGSMNSVSGDGTVIGNMKYCIETLMTKKPTAQLIVLLPLNTNRQWTGMDTMTEADNWAFGYGYRYNQTLEDYRDAIRECAEYYNVKVVDLEEVCPINRLNIRNVCGDGLHPTKAFHKQMGQALAPLIH